MNSDTMPRVARRITSLAVVPLGIPLPTGDVPIPMHRYYTPPPRPSASCERQKLGEAPALALIADTSFHNTAAMTSGHGGVGLGIMASMLIWTLTRREHSCALIDADFVAGYPDLPLGVGRESGLRFSQVDAPPNRIEGNAMNYELTTWEGVRVPPYDPWNAHQPDWQEVQAAIRTLAETNSVIIVDAGQDGLAETVPDLCSGVQMIVAELSVIGLVRAKLHRSRLDSWGCEVSHIIGVEPHGTPCGRNHVGIGEAQNYLTATALGPVKPSANLCGGVLEGLGIRSVTKGSRRATDLLTDLVEQAIRPVSGTSCKNR